MYKSKIGWATHVNEPFVERDGKIKISRYKQLSKIYRNRKEKSSVLISNKLADWAMGNYWQAVEILQACEDSPHLCYLLTNDTTAIPEIVRLWSLQYRQEEWPQNVWLGFTATDQKSFDENWAAFTDEADGVLGRFPNVNVFVQYKAVGALVLPDCFYKNNQNTAKVWGDKNDVGMPDNWGKSWGPFGEKLVCNRWLIASITKNPSSPEWLKSIRGQCVGNGILFYFINGSVYDLDYMLFGETYKETPLIGAKHWEIGAGE